MNVRRRRAAHALVVLGLWGTSSGAEAAVPLSLGARAPEPEAPPAEEDGFAFEDESEEAPPEEVIRHIEAGDYEAPELV